MIRYRYNQQVELQLLQHDEVEAEGFGGQATILNL